MSRTGQYDYDNRMTTRAKADRMRHRPRLTLQSFAHQYALEAPAKLNSGAVLAEDGNPAMSGEASGWIGFHQGEDGGQPNDWRKVACRLDEDGKYVTPMRCAIARVNEPAERKLLGELATNVLYPLDVTRYNGIPDWCRGDVIAAALDRLWRNYRTEPMPQRSRISDAQADAEAEVAV